MATPSPPPAVPAVRHDPLRNYQFKVSMRDIGQVAAQPGKSPPDKRVAGVQRVSGLTATVSPTEVWEGGNNLHRYANPDRVTWDPVTLEQGVALDETLERWAEAVRLFAMRGITRPDQPVKRQLIIELWPPNNVPGPPWRENRPARRYTLINAWISKYNALPKLDALASEVALISVELVHEGWTVDYYTPPASPPAS